jgi:hypothetical protein
MKLLSALLLLGLLLPSTALAFTFNPNNIISDAEFKNSNGLTRQQIHDFLGRGALQNMILPDWQGIEKSVADIIHEAAINNGVNPKVILALLQKEQSLITSTNPTQKQLDWAAGYAVCDDCSMDDPRIQRWRGFGRQVNSATLQFTQGYFRDIEVRGSTVGRFGPGMTTIISGQEVTPENKATASLYAYTPHVHGNQLFARIYNTWFSRQYPNGQLIKSANRPEVYLIRNNQRQHITTFAVFTSMFDVSSINIVDQSIIDNIPLGSPIRFPNYAILRNNNIIYLLNGDSIQPFESKETYNRLGFSDDEIIDVSQEEITGYSLGNTITSNTRFPMGRLVRINNSGSIFYVEGNSRQFVHSDLLKLQFLNRPVFNVSADEIGSLRSERPLLIADGHLVKIGSSPVVYLVENSQLRPIPDMQTFNSYGWRTNQIVTISEELFNNHNIGSALQSL